MKAFKRLRLQTRIENLLETEGSLEKFQNTDFFRSEFPVSASLKVSVVRISGVVSCNVIESGAAPCEDIPGVAFLISENGKWRMVGQYRKHVVTRAIKAA